MPSECEHNAHMYYVLLPDTDARTRVLAGMKSAGVNAIFHYVPLHDSPAGKRFGRACGELDNTVNLSQRIVRLPLWVGLDESAIEKVIDALTGCLK